MRRIEYENDDKKTGNTETHIATDEAMRDDFNPQLRLEEGFAASSGVSNETAESGGRIKNPERGDASIPSIKLDRIEEENAGLADA